MNFNKITNFRIILSKSYYVNLFRKLILFINKAYLYLKLK